MEEVQKLIKALYDKYGEYISFTYSCGENKGVYYEKWNIYTPTIHHNTFIKREDFIRFFKGIIVNNVAYKEHIKNELLEEKATLIRRLERVEIELSNQLLLRGLL